MKCMNIGAALLKKQADLGAGSILVATAPSPARATIDLQVEIIRQVAAVKHAENTAKTQAASKKAEAARLDELIQRREGNELSIDELKKRRAAL